MIQQLDPGGLACPGPASPAGCRQRRRPGGGAGDINTRCRRPSFIQRTVAAQPNPQLMQDLLPELGMQIMMAKQESTRIPGLQIRSNIKTDIQLDIQLDIQ